MALSHSLRDAAGSSGKRKENSYMLKQERLPPVDWMVGTGLVIVAILSVFYGSPELSSNVTSGLIGFLGRSVISKKGAK